MPLVAAVDDEGGVPVMLGLHRLPHGKLKPGVQVVTSLETLYTIVIVDTNHRIVGMRRSVSAKSRYRMLDNLYVNYGMQPDNDHVGVPVRKGSLCSITSAGRPTPSVAPVASRLLYAQPSALDGNVAGER